MAGGVFRYNRLRARTREGNLKKNSLLEPESASRPYPCQPVTPHREHPSRKKEGLLVKDNACLYRWKAFGPSSCCNLERHCLEIQSPSGGKNQCKSQAIQQHEIEAEGNQRAFDGLHRVRVGSSSRSTCACGKASQSVGSSAHLPDAPGSTCTSTSAIMRFDDRIAFFTWCAIRWPASTVANLSTRIWMST